MKNKLNLKFTENLFLRKQVILKRINDNQSIVDFQGCPECSRSEDAGYTRGQLEVLERQLIDINSIITSYFETQE